MSRRITGWALDRHERDALLQRFAPSYARPICDHVTLKFGSGPAPVPEDTEGRIVGFADDGEGVQAAVVEIGGTTARPDGSVYHITWSLAPRRQAKESNDVIARLGWQALEEAPVAVNLKGAAWSAGD